MIAEPIILLVSIIAAFIIQNVFIIRDDRAANETTEDGNIKKWWHAAGGLQHIWVMYVIGRWYGWHWAPFAGALTWYFMDGCINSFVLSREWWYIGTTAALDKVQRWAAGVLHIDPRLFSACLKHAVLILSILYLIPHLL